MKDYRKLNKFIYVIALLFIYGCEETETTEQLYTGTALGTTYQIKFFHSEEIAMEPALDSIFRVINQSMSTYIDTSDISKINAGDSTIAVDSDFIEVFYFSDKIYRESNGFFDPTVGNLVNAYGFGPERGDSSLTQAKIDSMLQYVGFNKLELKPDNTISKEHPLVYIDFNAIAKGYTVDVIARFLDQENVQNYLIEIGGELVAKGINKNKEQPWTVAIDDPLQTDENRTFKTVVQLKNRAMATSGNYRKYRVDSITGQRFVHTINPITGLSQKNNLLSVSVLAENCALADGYATAFMALGLEPSIEMLKRIKGVDVYFIYSEENEEVKVYTTEGFENNLIAN